jgi:hypothetical protein
MNLKRYFNFESDILPTSVMLIFYHHEWVSDRQLFRPRCNVIQPEEHAETRVYTIL